MASSLALDVKETPDTFMVTASVPGVPPSDIDITILGDTLRIRRQRKEEIEETGEGTGGCCENAASGLLNGPYRCRRSQHRKVRVPTSRTAS